jgi:hypothetical protein
MEIHLPDRDQEAGELYSTAREAVRSGGHDLRLLAGHLPLMIKGTHEHKGPLWRDRVVPPDGRRIHLDSFRDYLLRPAREGLGLPSLHFLRQVLSAVDDRNKGIEALDLVAKELKRVDGLDFNAEADRDKAKLLASTRLAKHGGARKRNEQGAIGTLKRGTNSVAYLAGRLARDRPDLSARTEVPKSDLLHLSIRQAALEAGFVKSRALSQLRSAWKKATEEERQVFRNEIG